MSTKNKLVLAIFVLIIVCILYSICLWFLFFFKDKTKEYVNREQEYITDIESQKFIENTIKEIGDDLNLLSESVIKKEEEIVFIEFIESLAKENNLNLIIASVDEIKKDVFNELNFKIAVEGTWTSVMKFVSLLENSKYRLIFKQMSISLIENTSVSRSQKWRASIDFIAVKSNS